MINLHQTRMQSRIGFGFDVHPLTKGKPLFIGGVELEHTHGLDGHSDADVLLHAICDALLGAANLRDIGFHFPNTDPKYKGINSIKLLEEVAALLKSKGYSIGNIDSTLCMEEPKINPHIPKMQIAIANACGIETEDISIKATTNEQLGFIGRQEGATAYAVALIGK